MHHINLKNRILILACVMGISSLCHAETLDVSLCDIKADVDLEHDKIDILASLDLTKPEALEEFNFMLSSDAIIHSLKCKLNSQSYDMIWDFIGKDTMHIAFPPDMPSSQNLIIEIKYTFSIESYKDDVIVLGRGHRWYPHIFDGITKYRLSVTVPEGYIVIATGDLVKEEEFSDYSQYVWLTNTPVFKLPLVITKSDFYKTNQEEINNKTVVLYSFTADEEVREKIITEVKQSFEFYEDLIGEYHHKCLTFIEIPDFPTIRVSSSLIMFGPKYTKEYKEGHDGRFILPIAHQWYAAGIFFELFGKGFWFFQMSLPQYLRLMYIQETEGDSVFSEILNKNLQDYKEIENTDDEVAILDVDFPRTPAKGSVIYGKGPYVVHRLRDLMGDPEWEKFIKEFYTQYKGGIATYDDFVKSLSRYDPSGSIVVTLEKMLSEKGLPEK